MAEIRVTPAEVRNKAGELRSLQAKFKDYVGALKTSELSLGAMWEGEAKNAFHAAFTKDTNQMDTFAIVIEQYAKALEEIASEYESKESMNAQIASARNY